MVAPITLPKKREYVDHGSAMFVSVVRNVPVLAPKHQSMVSREAREQSVAGMIGTPHEDDDAEKAKLQREAAEPGQEETLVDEKADRNLVVSCIRRRKMHKHNDTMLPWFPHDNDMELLKELAHESGRPRWVIFGTPAGGAGIHGCLEMGLSVVALCSDDHHRDVLNRCMLERAVEAMVSQTTVVFRDDSLRTWSIQLNLAAKDDAAKGDDDDADPPKETKKDKDPKQAKKASKDTPPKKVSIGRVGSPEVSSL